MANIFNLSEATAIGVHCCVLLVATKKKTLSAREISNAFAVSYDHTVWILQRLRQANILESVRGPSGGFRLTPPGGKRKLITIYEILEGPLSTKTCLFQTAKCEGTCGLFGELTGKINQLTHDFFNTHTLDDLAATLVATQTELYPDGEILKLC